MPVNLLIIGQTGRAEAKPLADWLRVALQAADRREHRDLKAALHEIVADSWIPDLVVCVQSWPDEFSSDDVESLFSVAPLARIVVAFGDWCESDGRNRNAWPLAVRISLRSAKSRIEHEWRLLNHQVVVTPLPMSGSRDEVFAADHPPLFEWSAPVDVTVDSPDSAFRQYLEQLLTNSRSADNTPLKPAALISPVLIFDADPWTERRLQELRNIKERTPSCRIVALQNLPDANSHGILLEAGADEILPKLGDQQRLLDALNVIH